MKYIITESQNEKMIMNYLSDSFSDLKHVTSEGEEKWINDGGVVFEINEDEEGDIIFFPNPDYVKIIAGLFSLKFKDSFNYIRNWFDENIGVPYNLVKLVH